MRLQRSLTVFCITLILATASHAYVGLKLGAFNSNGTTHLGGGVIFGLPLPVTGLSLEAEVMGFYDSALLTDILYLQANVGASYDFNTLITPDSDLIHPYARTGLAYGFNFYSNAAIDNDSAPGFYTGLGVNFKLPVITIGIEGNYNYINFNQFGTSQDYWNVFVSGGIHF